MLFFALFALCYSQTTQYCYTEVKSGTEVVGYTKTPKGTTDCPSGSTAGDKDPKLTKDYVCIEEGSLCKLNGQETVAEDSPSVTKTTCVIYDKCVALGETNMKYTLEGQKVKASEFSQANCPSDDSGKETNEHDCNKCEDGSITDKTYKCIKAAADEPAKGNYCYYEEKKDGKTIGYIKKPKNTDGGCDVGELKESDPKIEGDHVCVNNGAACPVNDANYKIGYCLISGGCLKLNEESSQKYTVDGDTLKIQQYKTKDCTGTSDDAEGECGICKDGIDIKCGAFETAILLAIAFLFFLF